VLTVRSAYGRTQTTERYYCKFGLNPAYVARLEHGGLVVSGVGRDGEVRILEHQTLRFFMGTLFVPQTSSAAGKPHPVVVALLEAAAAHINAPNEPIAQYLTR
jgi:CTP synthase (UTP-ammonia lyase)